MSGFLYKSIIDLVRIVKLLGVFTKNVGIFDTFHLEVIRNFKKMAFSEIVLAKSSWKFQV